MRSSFTGFRMKLCVEGPFGKGRVGVVVMGRRLPTARLVLRYLGGLMCGFGLHDVAHCTGISDWKTLSHNGTNGALRCHGNE